MNQYWTVLTYALAWTVFAYLCGSVSFAVVVSRVVGLKDPRTFGSHNPGATNVLRTGNKLAALATLVLDGFKGWVPLVIAKAYVLQNPVYDLSSTGLDTDTVFATSFATWLIAGVAISAFAGHLWPVFFGFKGGKGVATAAGLLLGMQPMLGLCVLLTWIAVAALTRYSSLSALISAALAPVYLVLGAMFLWTDEQGQMSTNPWPLALAAALMAVLLIYRHKENIARLLAGEEGKIFSKKTASH